MRSRAGSLAPELPQHHGSSRPPGPFFVVVPVLKNVCFTIPTFRHGVFPKYDTGKCCPILVSQHSETAALRVQETRASFIFTILKSHVDVYERFARGLHHACACAHRGQHRVSDPVEQMLVGCRGFSPELAEPPAGALHPQLVFK
ncbi:hypothetical protein NN561_008779 [Cricetulus griseus]